jgi:hypothetical protein
MIGKFFAVSSRPSVRRCVIIIGVRSKPKNSARDRSAGALGLPIRSRYSGLA